MVERGSEMVRRQFAMEASRSLLEETSFCVVFSSILE